MKRSAWHIVYTKPQFERTVFTGMIRQGIEAFLPTRIEIRQWSDRKKKVEAPLFPGYVFVKIEEENLYKALMVRGAVNYLSFADEIAVLKEEEIERIKALLDDEFELEVVEPLVDLSVGDHILLEEGPLAGQEVQFIEYKGKKRGLFKFEAIGKHVLVNVPLDTLTPVSIAH